LTIDEGLFVEELVNRFEEEKEERKIERQCKTKTLFRLSTNREGSYTYINAPLDTGMREHLRTKYGNTLVEIINDKFQS